MPLLQAPVLITCKNLHRPGTIEYKRWVSVEKPVWFPYTYPINWQFHHSSKSGVWVVKLSRGVEKLSRAIRWPVGDTTPKDFMNFSFSLFISYLLEEIIMIHETAERYKIKQIEGKKTHVYNNVLTVTNWVCFKRLPLL